MTITQKVDQRKYSSVHEYWKGKSEELRQNGYVIKIKHERTFFKWLIVNNVARLKKVLITKAQRKYAGQTLQEHEEGLLPSNPTFDGYQLRNNGGRTTITILKDEVQVGQGISRVNSCDNFIRVYGLGHALHAAIQDMNGVGGLASKREDN